MARDCEQNGSAISSAEDAIVHGLHQRDGPAFEAFVELYLPRVSRLAFRLSGSASDAEDIVQDVFLAAWLRGGQLKQPGRLWPWLAAITVNRSRSLHRRRKLSLRHLARAFASRAEEAHSPADGMGERESAGEVVRAVQELPLKLREVAVLRYLEELEIPQLAEVLGLSRNAAEVRLHRARAMLRERLRPYIED